MSLRVLLTGVFLLTIGSFLFLGNLVRTSMDRSGSYLQLMNNMHMPVMLDMHKLEVLLPEVKSRFNIYQRQPKLADALSEDLVFELLNLAQAHRSLKVPIDDLAVAIEKMANDLELLFRDDPDYELKDQIDRQSLESLGRHLSRARTAIQSVGIDIEVGDHGQFKQLMRRTGNLMIDVEEVVFEVSEWQLISISEAMEPLKVVRQLADGVVTLIRQKIRTQVDEPGGAGLNRVAEKVAGIVTDSKRMMAALQLYDMALMSNDPSSAEIEDLEQLIEALYNRQITVVNEQVIELKILQAGELESSLLHHEQNQRLLMVLAVSFIGLLLVVILLILRKVQIPIFELVRRAQDLSEGQVIRSHPGGMLKEFNALFSAFTRTSDNLQEKDRELRKQLGNSEESKRLTEKLNEELEDRVDERTRDLDTARLRAESANRAKSEFLATMSHEIRTPLNGVLGMLHLLGQSKLETTQRRHLETAENSSELLLKVINDVLDFSKLESHKLELESIPFNPIQLIEETAGMLAKLAHQKGVELIVSVAPSVPCQIAGDPTRLQQIILNLVNNAIKFTEIGHVAIYAYYWGGNICIGVLDTGIGLDETQQASIFQAFTQADSTHTRKYGGSGLGLAICRRLIEAMAGELKLSSAPGLGSDFHFSLPAVNPVHQTGKLALPDGLGDMRILLAEYQENTRDAIERMFATWDVGSVSLASSADEVVEQIRAANAKNQPFDLFLFNAGLAGGGSEQLNHLIRREAGEHEVNLVELLTTNQERIDDGVDAWITKPVRTSILFDTILDVYGFAVGLRKDRDVDMRKRWFGGQPLLLVEDSTVNQEVATEMLIGVGFSVDVCENGKEAIDRVQQNDYVAVLMDIQMPVMDGITATGLIRQLGGKYAELPILAMTAHALSGDRQSSLDAGMNAHITKPIAPQQLFDELARWVEESDAADSLTQEVVEADALVPELPGLDYEDAIFRLGGNKSAYFRILRNFAKRNHDVVARIAQQIKTDNVVEAAQLAHTLKGSSGNIGARKVHELASSVERHCRNSEPANALEELAALEHSLAILLAGLTMLDEREQGEYRSAG